MADRGEKYHSSQVHYTTVMPVTNGHRHVIPNSPVVRKQSELERAKAVREREKTFLAAVWIFFAVI